MCYAEAIFTHCPSNFRNYLNENIMYANILYHNLKTLYFEFNLHKMFFCMKYYGYYGSYSAWLKANIALQSL